MKISELMGHVASSGICQMQGQAAGHRASQILGKPNMQDLQVLLSFQSSNPSLADETLPCVLKSEECNVAQLGVYLCN